MGVTKRLKIVSLNPHLICTLCGGYYVGATAIKDCLHTFCRSCILKYIQTNSFCPICEVQIHKECNKLWASLRPDKTLQDLVYKMVPGLYQDEMRRRRHFYSLLEKDSLGAGEESGFLPNGARFFSQDDSISLSLEYYSQDENDEKLSLAEKFKMLNERARRYLQCPAAVTVRHLKKFLRMKYGIGLDCWVDVIYNDECLPENFSLMDVAYTFSWKRTSPMRFSYRIFTRASIRALKSNKKFHNPSVRDEEIKKPKSALEQQKQSEYLGNFNLNPTNPNICRTQNSSKTSSYTNSKSCEKSGTFPNENRQKKNDIPSKNYRNSEDGSKYFPSSEDSEASGLRIISEKEESAKENSDSDDSIPAGLINRKKSVAVSHFEEETVDSFTAKKLLKNKHKWEEKKRRIGESSASRRKSASLIHEYESVKKKESIHKRRKTVADELSLKQERTRSETFENDDEDVSLGDLKSEALRKVFVTKEKPEMANRRKEEEIRKKKRKKSKHHEEKMKKRKLEHIHTSPSVLSVDKDALKLKVKLPTNKSTDSSDQKFTNDSRSESEKGGTKSQETETKKPTSEKERLFHLRAVRHKTGQSKDSPSDFINPPSSLTISKVDSSEPQSTKSALTESKPSLEITLVNPIDKSKVRVEVKVGPPIEKKKDIPKQSGVLDNFGVLDLSEKSTRTKDAKPNSCFPDAKPNSCFPDAKPNSCFTDAKPNSCFTDAKPNSCFTDAKPTKEAEGSQDKVKKNTHQSIMRIAHDLVNRKLPPPLPVQHVKTFDSMVDSSTASAMRNLKTLSDTAVNILMAAQSKAKSECQKPYSEPPPLRPHPKISSSTNSSKDCDKDSGLKIPMYPICRPTLLPKLLAEPPKLKRPIERPMAPTIVRPQNQTVRQIPDPFMVLNRQNQNQSFLKPQSEKKCENGEGKPSKVEIRAIPPLQSIKKTLLPRKLDLPKKEDLFGLKTIVPNLLNNNTKTVQNSESNFFSMKNGDERKGINHRMYNSISCIRKAENLSKSIESVAAGLTARAVSNAIDAK